MYFLLVALVLTVLISLVFLYIEYNKKRDKVAELKAKLEKQQVISQTPVNIIESPVKLSDAEVDLVTARDYRVLNDPLVPGNRRPYLYEFPPGSVARYIDIPTRGYPDNYQYLGNMFRKSDEKVIKLFGRQKFAGSNQYEYYGISADKSGLDYKIPIEKKNDKEIYDKDVMDIPFYNDGKGPFTVYINKDQTFRYNPYVI